MEFLPCLLTGFLPRSRYEPELSHVCYLFGNQRRSCNIKAEQQHWISKVQPYISQDLKWPQRPQQRCHWRLQKGREGGKCIWRGYWDLGPSFLHLCFNLGSQCFAQAGLKLGLKHSSHFGFPRLQSQEHTPSLAPLSSFHCREENRTWLCDDGAHL